MYKSCSFLLNNTLCKNDHDYINLFLRQASVCESVGILVCSLHELTNFCFLAVLIAILADYSSAFIIRPPLQPLKSGLFSEAVSLLRFIQELT